MNGPRNVDRFKAVVATQLRAQKLNGFANVFLAVIENGFSSPLTPISRADVLGDRRFVEPLPTLDAVSAARHG
jgi:hypothetical protein